ncbi:MAG: hypothetical protein EXS10_02830 [Phycisphaerales bacterium]|nr:hypothetical protein [Phycisphaerales bacterium]
MHDPSDISPSQPYVVTNESGDAIPAKSTWPMVVGSICVAYGVLGMCLQGGSVLFTNFGGQLMQAQGIDFHMPSEMALAMNVQASILLPLGIVLAIGGAMLLMRRKLGAKLVLVWAAARILMAIVGLAWGMMTLDVSVDYSREILESMASSSNPAIAKAAQADLDNFDVASVRSDGIRNLVLVTLGMSIMPCVIGFLLTTKKRAAEVQSW